MVRCSGVLHFLLPTWDALDGGVLISMDGGVLISMDGVLLFTTASHGGL